MAPKFGMGFFGGLILVHNFLGVLFEALGIFGGLIFAPTRSSLSPEIWSWSTPTPNTGKD